MSAKAGIKKDGAPAVDAMKAEFAEFENLSVYEVLDPSKLTSKKKIEALRSISLIKEKRDGRLKGRTVADVCYRVLCIPNQTPRHPPFPTTRLCFPY
jgi:hypothetical protein